MKNRQALARLVPFCVLVLLMNTCGYITAHATPFNEAPLSVSIGKDTSLPIKQSTVTTFSITAKTQGDVKTYLWTQVSGEPVDFSSKTASSITLSGFKEGYYSFKCEVGDGLTTASDVIVIRAVNYQNKNRVPCRKGAPRVWTLSATNQFDLIYPYLRRDGRDIQGGDTIKINRNPNNNGVYARFYLGDFGGDEGCPVIVVPNGQIVEIGGPAQRWHIGKNNNNTSDSNFVNHAVIDGTYLRNKGIEYGFQSTGASWGLSTSMVTDLEIRGVLFKNNSLGIQMKIYSDSSYAWTVYDNFVMKNIKIHDNYFQNIRSNEGMYVGHTSPSGSSQAGNQGPTPRMDSVFIYNNFIDSSGWDAMQVSSARYSELHDNIIMHSSLINQSSQNWGLLIGGNSTGKIYNNIVYNGTSGTIGTLGYGATEIFYNFLDSTTGSSMYINGLTANILEANIAGKLPPIRMNIHDNIMSRFDANAVHHTNNDKRALPGVIEKNYVVHPTKSLAQTLISNARDVIRDNVLVKQFPVTVRNIGNPATGVKIRVTQGPDAAEFSNSKDAIDWLFRRISGKPVPNQLPVANAGAAITITLPVSTVTLKGAGSDPDGTISGYTWSKVSGPASFNIANPSASTTAVTGLEAGIYRFRLAVTDNLNATGADTVQVTVLAAPVNVPPVAEAGLPIVITLPVSSVNVAGAGTDKDGTIAGYQWSYVSGPGQYSISSPAQAKTSITGLVAGVYKFELRVTDNQGAVGKDTVTITVNAAPLPNQLPVANAGSDLAIRLPTSAVNVDGSASKDADGTITSYLWTYVAGPASYHIVSPGQKQTAINNLVQGTYRFELKVTDNRGGVARDTIVITVAAAIPANQLPIANAGSAVSLTLPQNTVTLNGSGSYDPDGTISSYTWSQVAGPAASAIKTAGSPITTVANLVQGVYRFELSVTDNRGGVGRDTIIVTVMAAPVNQPPVADAGNDITIMLPNSSITVTGARSYDRDGVISTFLWKKVAGPDAHLIENPSSSTTIIRNLNAGVYKFELTVTDNDGAIDKDTVMITVTPASIPNQAPTANAGDDITITLPVNTILLNASGFDPDGIIVSYKWNKIAGPASFTIVASTQKQTQVTGLIAGGYQFELIVTDNQGASGKDTITVFVKQAIIEANEPPVADAGDDITVTLPTNTAFLDGAGSTDTDGYIVTQKWIQANGPSVAHLVTPFSTKTEVRLLEQGVYTFVLMLTDNRGASSSDTVIVKVLPAQSGVEAYPNPAADYVDLSIKSNTQRNNTDVQIFDVKGMRVQQHRFMRNAESVIHRIDVSQLSKGMYYIHVQVDINNYKTVNLVKL